MRRGEGHWPVPSLLLAVILPTNCSIDGLRDSKQLTPKKRDLLADKIRGVALSIGIGSVDNRVVDSVNVLEATLLAMRDAIEELTPQPDYLLVDGIYLPATDIQGEAIPKGDSRSYSIAAASIIAKTTRDRLMVALDRTYPDYGFSQHKGYPTSQHRQAITKFGASDIHRHTFKLLPDD